MCRPQFFLDNSIALVASKIPLCYNLDAFRSESQFLCKYPTLAAVMRDPLSGLLGKSRSFEDANVFGTRVYS